MLLQFRTSVYPRFTGALNRHTGIDMISSTSLHLYSPHIVLTRKTLFSHRVSVTSRFLRARYALRATYYISSSSSYWWGFLSYVPQVLLLVICCRCCCCSLMGHLNECVGWTWPLTQDPSGGEDDHGRVVSRFGPVGAPLPSSASSRQQPSISNPSLVDTSGQCGADGPAALLSVLPILCLPVCAADEARHFFQYWTQ